MNHSESLRIFAERYMHLADTTSDPAERLKYLDYAQAYNDLSEQVARRERSEERECPEGRNPGEHTKGPPE